MGFHRSAQRYRSRRDPQVELRMRLRDLAAVRVRYGYRRLHVLLRREGWPVNHKRTYRLYAEEGLSIRTKLPRRKRAWCYRQGRPGAAAPNEIWAMDFVSDQLFDGHPIRILTVVDIHTREGLSTHPRANFRAAQVVEILDGLVRLRGKPKSLRVDNGPEFAGRARPLGLSERGGARFLQARKAHRQRLHRGVQCPPAGGVSERLVVPVLGRRQATHRGMEVPLQRGAAALSPGQLDPKGLRQPS